MTDFDRAMRDPKSCFDEPSQVVSDDTLTNDEKIKVLKQWEYDARELSVAEEGGSFRVKSWILQGQVLTLDMLALRCSQLILRNV